METLVVDLPSAEESMYAKLYGEEVGQGAYRTVYRVPGSRWVYKFEGGTFFDSGTGANAQEVKNYTHARESLPPGIDFPEMHMLPNGVVAAEFVDGVLGRDAHDVDDYTWKETCNCASHRSSMCWREAVANVMIEDLNGGNVIISSDGRILIIDIGESGTK